MDTQLRRRHAQRRTVGRWIDDMIRTIERRAASAAAVRAAPGASSAGRPALRLRRDLNHVLGL
jgi:hypothetical protein